MPAERQQWQNSKISISNNPKEKKVKCKTKEDVGINKGQEGTPSNSCENLIINKNTSSRPIENLDDNHENDFILNLRAQKPSRFVIDDKLIASRQQNYC